MVVVDDEVDVGDSPQDEAPTFPLDVRYGPREGHHRSDPGPYNPRHDNLPSDCIYRQWYVFAGWILRECHVTSDEAGGQDSNLHYGVEFCSLPRVFPVKLPPAKNLHCTERCLWELLCDSDTVLLPTDEYKGNVTLLTIQHTKMFSPPV